MAIYTFSSLNDPSGVGGTNPFGLNDAGQIVGIYFDSGGAVHGFLLSGSSYTNIDDPLGINGTIASNINTAGQIAGDYIDSSSTPHGFVYTGGSYVTINDPLGTNGTLANGINSAGQVVGQYSDINNFSHGFLYNGSTYTTLDDPLGAGGTIAFGINNAGKVVGEYVDSSGVVHGFLYAAGNYFTLDDPLGANGTIALSINDFGQIVGEYFDSTGMAHGFLYSGGSYITLDDPMGVGGTVASSINNAAQIVGEYFDSSGTAHGFLATDLVSAPPPTSVQQEVLGLYAALYNRAADFPGYSFWVGLDSQQSDSSGVTVANANTTAITLNDAGVLGQAFVNTQAGFFNGTYGSLSDSQFINAIYANIGGNAGDPNGIAYWASLLAHAEASGQSVQAARAGLVGQFVHDLIDTDLSPGAAALGLNTAQYQAALVRQATIDDKIAVSLAFLNASQLTGGSILDAHSVGDAAYNAAVTVLQGVTSDSSTVLIAITGINNAVAQQNLALI